MKYLSSFLIFLVFKASSVFSQAASDWVFDDSVLPEVHVLIETESLEEILDFENRNSDYEYPATFIFIKGEERDTVNNIGFRLRGNTSRDSQKKSFKVSFNTFEQGRQYKGLDKMNLNGEHNDPSIIRSKLSWDIFKKADVIAPRANHVKFYINGEYFGLYINVEHIDDEFVEKHFGTDAGNLYKNLYPADLTFISENPNDYKWSPDWADRRVYELKTNTDEDNYSDLSRLISFLANGNTSEFEVKAKNFINVDGVIRWMAIDILTGNWDNYWYNQNNYYLYFNPVDQRFEFIPYDYDNTFGIDWVGQDWGNKNIYTWGPVDGSRPLVQRILGVEDFRNRLSYYLQQFIEDFFNEETLFSEIDRLKLLTEDAAEEDIYRTLDYEYGVSEYHNSFTMALGGHVDYGLKPYITQRITSVLNQLEIHDIKPIITDVHHNSSTSNNEWEIFFSANVIDEGTANVNAFLYSVDTLSSFQSSISLNDDGVDADLEAGDGTYSGSFNLPNTIRFIEFSIKADDGETGVSESQIKRINFPVKTNGLVINEFMADNETGIQDESGAFEDWIELYNPTDQPVNLTGYYLTGDFSDIEKWALPDTTVQPGGFILFWADNDDEEGIIHTNFGLNNDGEQIGLYYKNGSEIRLTDSLSFGIQSNDVSYGRVTDGDSAFIFFEIPTPGAPNGLVNSNENEEEQPQELKLFQNYPNPFNPSTTISFQLERGSVVKLEIFSMNGRLVQTLANSRFNSGHHSIKFDASELSSGIYFYRLSSESQSITKQLVLIK